MSITIVSTLPQASPTPTNDNGAGVLVDGGTSASTSGFLSLLLGQLASSTESSLTIDETLAKDTAEAANDIKTEADPSSLFAAFGLIPIDLKTDAASRSPSKASDISPISGEKKTTPGIQEILASSHQENSSPTASENMVSAGNVATVRETAAKFAAEQPFATAETPAPQELRPEALPPGIAAASTSPSHATRDETSITVDTPVRHANWHDDFSQKIVWMATGEKQSAQLTLNPPQMGPIEVTLNVDKGSATATFASANVEVREAIETALPRLREMFANVGIDLGQANVSAESFRQQADSRDSRPETQGNRPGDGGILAVGTTTSTTSGVYATRQGNGLVDTFA